MINIIYGLRDPRNDVYQYIGKSTAGTERALQHLTHSHSPKVTAWASLLEEKGLCPIVDIIEEVSDLDKLAEREKYWIIYYSDINPNLFNIQLVDHPLQNIRNKEDGERFSYLVEIMADIYNTIKKERLCRNLTQEAMALSANISLGSIRRFDRGENVSLGTIIKYINALNRLKVVRRSYNQKATKR